MGLKFDGLPVGFLGLRVSVLRLIDPPQQLKSHAQVGVFGGDFLNQLLGVCNATLREHLLGLRNERGEIGFLLAGNHRRRDDDDANNQATAYNKYRADSTSSHSQPLFPALNIHEFVISTLIP